MAKSSIEHNNNLAKLQEQAYDRFIKGKYDEAVSLYKQLISFGSTSKASYWYLGLSQLLQAQETEAQMTWLLAVENAEPEQLEQWTNELGQVLDQEAQRQELLEADRVAISIRYHLREINPYNFANLIAIIFLSIKLKTFTSEELVNLDIIDLLDSGEFLPIAADTLSELLQKILTFKPPNQLILEFVESICLSHIQYKEVIINKLIHIGGNVLRDIDVAIQVLEIGSRIDPQNLEVLIYLSELHANKLNLEKSIEIARNLYVLADSGRLIDKILACHSLQKALVFDCLHWEEAAKINQELNTHLWSLVNGESASLSLREASFYLLIVGFYSPYFSDCPQQAHALRKEVRQLAHDRIYASEKAHIDNYRKRQAIRKRTHTPNRPLRVGYLSISLRRHAVGSLVKWLLQYHDRDRFELYAYFVGYNESDPVQVWFANQVHKAYKEVVNSPLDLANQINQDGIDILVDLDSMTSAICAGVLNFKPAPIQVTWLGWDAAGQPTVDYFIADPYVLPESAETYYTEKIWRLPHTYIAVDGFEVAAPTVRRNLLNIPSNAVIYLSAQAAVKRHPRTIQLQMKILKLVPNSYLILKSMGDQDSLQDFFYKQAELEGISIDRLRFLPITNGEAEHRANLSIADVVLDTYPYNGATHTMETLWMGIPIVTRVGEQFAARNSYTMMINAGITEGIAWTDEEYVEWGVRLGKDVNLRQQIAWKLRQSRQTAPLWDTRQFTQDMENAYEQMWVKYLESDDQMQDIDPKRDRDLFVAEAEIQNSQGINFAQQGKLESAILSFQTAISLYSEYADAYYNLGIALSETGNLDQAVVNFQTTITLNSNHANALYNLGFTLAKQGKINEAIAYYSQALVITPNDIETHLALGNALFGQSKWEDAIHSYQSALAVDPNCASAHGNIGAALSEKGHLKEAIPSLQLAIQLDPNNAQAYCNLGHVFSKSEQMTAAIHCYETALQIKPDLGNAYWNFNNDVLIQPKNPLSNNYKLRRQLADQFVEMCSKTDKVRSLINFITNYTHSGLSDIVKPQLADLESYIFDHSDLLTSIEAECLYRYFSFILSSLRDEPAKNTRVSSFIGELYVEKVIKAKLDLKVFRLESDNYVKVKPSLEPNQLRIGFLSPNLSRHSVGWCSLDVIRELSNLTPHIYLYGTGDVKPDDITQRFEQVAEKFYWYEKNTLATGEGTFDNTLASVIPDISQDKLDVLIDLDSLTTPLNVNILYHQLAPVCISWLGFDAPFISSKNYYLSDWHTHPIGTEEYYREKLIRMPDSFVSVSHLNVHSVNRDEARADINVRPEQVIYLGVVPGRKLNPNVVKAQVEIIKHVPDSVFLHKGSGDMMVFQSSYRKECEEQGVDFSRFIFQGAMVPEEAHRTSYLIADVILDPYPFNGGTISLEALYFNLPLVTITGEQFFSRMGYSFLKTLGIEEGIAYNWEEYVEWGIKFGIDHSLRRSIKDKLTQSKQAETLSPLWNPQKFAQDLYSLLLGLVSQKVA